MTETTYSTPKQPVDMPTAPVGLGRRVRVWASGYPGLTGTICHIAPCTEWPLHVRFDEGQTCFPGSRFAEAEVEFLPEAHR